MNNSWFSNGMIYSCFGCVMSVPGIMDPLALLSNTDHA